MKWIKPQVIELRLKEMWFLIRQTQVLLLFNSRMTCTRLYPLRRLVQTQCVQGFIKQVNLCWVLQPHDLSLIAQSAAAGPSSMWAVIQQVS
jgi:hypothetical protein